MHDNLISIVLGVIEGLTEFLPVSSTAHLRLAEIYAFDISSKDEFWKTYSIVIQLGAIACLPIYFRKRLYDFIRTYPRGPNGDKTWFNHPIALVALATLCTIIPVLALKKVVSANLESMTVIGCSLLVGGIVMWVIDAVYGKRGMTVSDHKNPGEDVGVPTEPLAATGKFDTATPRDGVVTTVEDMKPWQAAVIGVTQTLAAVFPGSSRSMTTIAAGQLTGLSRAAALEFSFFLSIPIMLAAFVKELKDALRPSAKDIAAGMTPIHIHGDQWITLGIGFVVSFVVAYVVVAWFTSWVRRRGFVPFAIYRIVLGTAVLALALSGS